MNANELADAMEIRASIRRKATSRKSVQENANDRLADQLDEAATMLRQQQAEIEALKMDIHSLTYGERLTKYFNKPVAWMQVHYKDNKPTKFSKVQTWEDDVPLYTHPVKELTDEEIKDFLATFPIIFTVDDLCTFARAILRKAQER